LRPQSSIDHTFYYSQNPPFPESLCYTSAKKDKTVENLCVGPLVRAVHHDGVAIWTEWNHPCEVILTAVLDRSQNQEVGMVSVHSRTVTIGGRYYALSLLTNLQPATWYSYRVSDSAQEGELSSSAEETIIQCFRTLDLPNAENALRLAYGSCRRLSAVEPDALSALGSWLVRSRDERESLWPRLLLLIGDQIYADDPADKPEHAPSLKHKMHLPEQLLLQSFEDFAHIYVKTWTGDQGVRQVLAVLPTYMIFDDHEITNSWNISPAWRANVLEQGFEQTLVDGLVAYWVYQGWGNIGLQQRDEHDLLAIMQHAEQSGEDALEALRSRVRQAIYEEKVLQWDYTLPTMPPIFVADMRADRPALLDGRSRTDVVPRIMSQEQMMRLRNWMQEHDASTTLLVSSVPALLPPVIGFAEYIMGARPLQNISSGFLRRLGHLLAGGQQRIALRMSFDHWPVFGATWRELIALFATRKQDLVILSGDVHFSYAMSARRPFLRTKRQTALYQLVASPFRNKLEQRERSLILGQAWIKRAIYGGLYTRMLPLLRSKEAKRAPSGMLFQNVVALVTLWPQTQTEGKYSIRQVYLGVRENKLEEIASQVLSG
jgi:hypothetical protein